MAVFRGTRFTAEPSYTIWVSHKLFPATLACLFKCFLNPGFFVILFFTRHTAVDSFNPRTSFLINGYFFKAIRTLCEMVHPFLAALFQEHRNGSSG